MSEVKALNIWFYILFLPSFLALLGLSIVFFAHAFKWGGEANIPVPLLIGLFAAEFTMVMSGLGIAAFIKFTPKTTFVKVMGLFNVLILMVAGIVGFSIFMML